MRQKQKKVGLRMEKIIVCGQNPLRGTVRVQGAKNAALPILAACVLVSGVSTIENCPDLSDVRAAVAILKRLGCAVKRSGHTLTVDSRFVSCYTIPNELMREMRSSIVFLGSVLARTGKAVLCAPGGCAIGRRPIDLHLSALRALGAQIEEQNGVLCCRANRLCGAVVALPFPSVGATENALLAAAVANGDTLICGAAKEPEIDDLVLFLNRCGAKITRTERGDLFVRGTPWLHGCRHRVMPDRIAALTVMAAVGAAGGNVMLQDAVPGHLTAALGVFCKAGCLLETGERTLRIAAEGRLNAVPFLQTRPHPGFPTDGQAAVMAMLCTAEGRTAVEETIFENRFHHVAALRQMGARIRVSGRRAEVEGVPCLHGAAVAACDLRAGGALVVAGLGARGTTVIRGVRHIDRGYEKIETCFKTLGAQIERSADSGPEQPQSE